MELKHISKSFGAQQVLTDISLVLEEGHTLAVLGKSGCGKTTLLRIIAGLELADNGEIWLNGKNMSGVAVHKRNAVYLNQEPLLFPHMTASANIAYGLEVRGVPASDIRRQTEQMLAELGLEDQGHKRPHQLSGGQRQRVSFGRAMIIHPSVLLLDEPFGNLDPDTRKQMQELFMRLSAAHRITSLLVTHDLKEAILTGQQTAFMESGVLTMYPDTGAFLSDPRTGGQDEMAFWKKYNQS